MTQLEKIVSTRRSFLTTSAAAGTVGLLGLAAFSNAQVVHNSPLPSRTQTATGGTSIRPFRVRVPQADLVDLRRRIIATRWPERETVSDATQGVQLATMQKLAHYWANDYDWRKVEARLNALPQFVTTIDGLDIHFIHFRSKHANALPVTGRSVQAIVADLTDRADLARVEQVLRMDSTITLLVNNAGIGVPTPLFDSYIGRIERMIDLNVTALVRLTYAAVPAFLGRGNGAVINISSALGIAPELLNGVYGGTKAFVLAFSLSLQKEFQGRGVRVQAVLPGATATDFWDISGTPLDGLPSEVVMGKDNMVDAAIAGFEQGELITIPSLPDISDWEAYEEARQNLIPKLSLNSPAARYRITYSEDFQP